MDVRYHSTTLKNSYGCGQSASQAVGTTIEWQTDKHEIIGFHLENKLCKLGASLHNQVQNVSYPGHQGCTAIIRAVDPTSEFKIGRQIGVSFAQQQVGKKIVATHLIHTQFRYIMRASLSSRVFPGDNATIRAENKKMFAEDVRKRCQKIYSDMHTLYAGDIRIITTKMSSNTGLLFWHT